MPTIQQLPQSKSISATDELPVSQNGVAHAVSVGDLLAGTQTAIMAPTGSLLGRISLGPGGPEPVSVGQGIVISGGTLAANGADHASYPAISSPADTDGFVLSSSGAPRLLAASALKTWLGQSGSFGSFAFADAPTASTISASDLIAISQNGTAAAITYANLLDGETIDAASPAAPASDTDTFWVAQGSSTMLRQSLASIWTWAASKFPTYKPPIVELSADTTLDGTVHNGRILVCTHPLTLTPVFANMGSGFVAEVLNLSGGTVVFGGGIVTSSGQSSLPPGQMAFLRGLSSSQGNTVFAAILSGIPAGSAPGQVTSLSATTATASSIGITWSAPASGGAVGSYVLQYRLSGTTAWTSVAAPASATSAVIGALSAGASYELSIIAANAAGTGPVSTIITASTTAAANVPGQVSNLAVSNIQTNGLALSWSAPANGGTPASYTVQYSTGGGSGWSTYASGVTSTSLSVTGLAAGTTYSFQVLAVNSAGTGVPSVSVSASTRAATGSVSSITWNLVPAAQYAVGTGAIGVNVHVSPATAAVQFGLSQSTTVPPSSWSAGTYVNTDLWGVYLGVPSVAGTYYLWCEGTDGSLPTAYSAPITVS